MKFFTHVVDRICSLLFACIFCQIPHFIHAYLLCLQGHVAESKRLIQALERHAAFSQKDLYSYVQKFVSHTDQDCSRLGSLLHEIIHRHSELTHSMHTLEGANIFVKPFVFLYTLHKDIVLETAHHFRFGLSINLESVIYALLGLFVGAFVFRLFCFFLRHLRSLFLGRST